MKRCNEALSLMAEVGGDGVMEERWGAVGMEEDYEDQVGAIETVYNGNVIGGGTLG